MKLFNPLALRRSVMFKVFFQSSRGFNVIYWSDLCEIAIKSKLIRLAGARGGALYIHPSILLARERFKYPNANKNGEPNQSTGHTVDTCLTNHKYPQGSQQVDRLQSACAFCCRGQGAVQGAAMTWLCKQTLLPGAKPTGSVGVWDAWLRQMNTFSDEIQPSRIEPVDLENIR